MLCPFCKEEIQEGAIKCKHCGSMITIIVPPVSQIVSSSVPPLCKKWNWAAFLWGPIWAIGHKVWIGLLGFIPFVGWIMHIVLGVKGSQLAWQKGNYASVEQFQLRQKKWVKAWFIFIILIPLFFAIMIPQYKAYQRRAAEDAAQKQAQIVQNLEREAEEYFNNGISLVESKNLSEAIAAFDRAIKLNPNNGSFYSWRGVAYEDSGDLQEALRNHNKAIELNPQDGDAYYLRGLTYAKLGDSEQQVNDYKMAAKLGNENAQKLLKEAGIDW